MKNQQTKTKYMKNAIVSTLSLAVMFGAFIAPANVSVNVSGNAGVSAGTGFAKSTGVSQSPVKVSVRANSANAAIFDRKYITDKLKKPSSKPSTSKKKSSTPKGGEKSNNKYAKKSLSGDCKKVNGKCVVFSKSGCGNFYINGRHYGGSKSCRILGRCPRTTPPTTTTRRTNPNRPISNPNRPVTVDVEREDPIDRPACTVGVDCPPGDLGPVIRQSTVNPIFANDRNQCTLNWLATTNSDDVRVVCTLKSNGASTTTATSSPSMIPVGTTVLNCRREIKNTDPDADEEWVLEDEESREVGCRQNPAFIER